MRQLTDLEIQTQEWKEQKESWDEMKKVFESVISIREEVSKEVEDAKNAVVSTRKNHKTPLTLARWYLSLEIPYTTCTQ